jgi:ADP-ribose pyrophosphatase YjhB (NUDIX family)
VPAVRDVLLRQAYRASYRLVMLWRMAAQRRARGVKCLLTHTGEVLLVRHTYGPRRVWHVPGGGVRRGEEMIAAGAREMGEELGLHDLDWLEVGVLVIEMEHRPVIVGCLHCELAEREVRPDRAEIAEARWFSPALLPEPRGEEVAQLVALVADPRGGAAQALRSD